MHTLTKERPELRVPRKGSMRMVMIAGTLAAMATSNAAARAAPKEAEKYNSIFYMADIAPNAKIKGGSVIQTWITAGGTAIENDSHTIWKAGRNTVKFAYERAKTLILSDKIDRGFPINRSRQGGTVAVGWHPNAISKQDGHSNKATADLDVSRFAAGPLPVQTPGGPQQLRNYVTVNLEGTALAGPLPHEGPKEAHSADSAGGVFIKGAKIWEETTPGAKPKVKVFKKKSASGGKSSSDQNEPKKKRKGKNKAGIVSSLRDITTGQITTEMVMSKDLEWSNAAYNINDDVISLTIDNSSDDSYVGFEFSTVSDWVTNSYSYSVWVDADGIQVSGILPDASAWTQTVDGDSTTWELALDGEPVFDMAEIRAPDELTTAGNLYAYDLIAFDGTFDTAIITPTPGTFALLTFAGLTASRRRRC